MAESLSRIKFLDWGSIPTVGSSKKKKFRFMENARCQVGPALHPPGTGIDTLTGAFLKTDQFQKFGDPPGQFFSPQTVYPAEKNEGFREP